MADWTDEQIIEQFRREIRERFEAENAAYRKREAEDIAKLKREHPDDVARLMPDMEVRDSHLWDIYKRAEIEIVNNSVKVIAPFEFAIYSSFVEMFEGTSVGWTGASIQAKTVDYEPRIFVCLLLVDSWSDERHAEWLAKRDSWAVTSAEALLLKIKSARTAFALDPGGPKDPVDGYYVIEHWIDEFFRSRGSV